MISPSNDSIGSLLELKPSMSQSDLNIRMVCFFIAQGEPLSSVAQKLGLAIEFVERISSSPGGSELVVRLQTALYPDVTNRVKRTAHMALDFKVKALLATDTPLLLKNTIATDLLDRSEGKATQITENRNINFDAKTADELDRQILASNDRLKKISEMKLKLKMAEKIQ